MVNLEINEAQLRILVDMCDDCLDDPAMNGIFDEDVKELKNLLESAKKLQEKGGEN